MWHYVPRLSNAPRASLWYLLALGSTSSNAGVMVWPAVVLAGSVGGATLATGGTASMGNPAGGGSYTNPGKVFDGTDGTAAFTSKGFSDRSHSTWVAYEFTAPQTVVQVRMTSSTTISDDYNAYPTAFAVQVSYDGGTTRETVAVCYCDPWVSLGQTQSFTLSFRTFTNTRSAALAWRVRVDTKNSGSFSTAGELTWAATASGSQQATGGVPFVCSTFSIFNTPAAYLYDGDNGTIFYPSASIGGPPYYYGYVWPSGAPSLVEARLRRSGDVNDSPASVSIQWSSDFWNWNTTDTYSSLTWSNPETKTWAIS